MELKICNHAIIKRIAFHLPAPDDYTINVTGFIEGCRNLATFLGYFGIALRSIQYMILANIELILKWYTEKGYDDENDLITVLVKELEVKETQMNQAAYQIKKCLNFCSKLLYVLTTDANQEDITQQIVRSYQETLEPGLNRLPNWLFYTMLRSCRSKAAITSKLATEDEASLEETERNLLALSDIVGHVVAVLNEHFSCRWNMLDHYYAQIQE